MLICTCYTVTFTGCSSPAADSQQVPGSQGDDATLEVNSHTAAPLTPDGGSGDSSSIATPVEQDEDPVLQDLQRIKHLKADSTAAVSDAFPAYYHDSGSQWPRPERQGLKEAMLVRHFVTNLSRWV